MADRPAQADDAFACATERAYFDYLRRHLPMMTGETRKRGERILKLGGVFLPEKRNVSSERVPKRLSIIRCSLRDRFGRRGREFREWSKGQRALIGRGDWGELRTWLDRWLRFRCGSAGLQVALCCYDLGIHGAERWAYAIGEWMTIELPQRIT